MKETQEIHSQRWGVERLLGPPLAEFDVICKMYDNILDEDVIKECGRKLDTRRGFPKHGD